MQGIYSLSIYPFCLLLSSLPKTKYLRPETPVLCDGLSMRNGVRIKTQGDHFTPCYLAVGKIDGIGKQEFSRAFVGIYLGGAGNSRTKKNAVFMRFGNSTC